MSVHPEGLPAARIDLPDASAGAEARIGFRLGEAEPRVASYRCRAGALEGGPDAGFVAALPLAMALASELEAPPGLSPRLLAASERIQALLAAWDPGLHRVEVRPDRPGAAQPGAAGPARGTAAFFSGGVDSFYTVLNRLDEIDALVFVHGLDLPLEERRKGELISASLGRVAGALGLELVEVETDLRASSDSVCSWELIYTSAALASVGHLLGARFERFLIPATHSLRDLHPIGTHPLLDPLYSSERVRFEHVDSVTRVEKLAYLADSELAMAELRVCFQSDVEDALNCGKCAKCQRTVTGLRVVGATGRCATLPSELSLREMSSGKIVRPQALTYVRENLAAVEARGADPALELALRRMVARGARGEAWAQTRRLAATARSWLPGRIRRALRLGRRRR